MEFIEDIKNKLTARESRIVKLMAAGYTNSDIASELEVSSSLIKIILANVFVKLKSKNRVNTCYILGLKTKK